VSPHVAILTICLAGALIAPVAIGLAWLRTRLTAFRARRNTAPLIEREVGRDQRAAPLPALDDRREREAAEAAEQTDPR
jgi:hypothetical protein